MVQQNKQKKVLLVNKFGATSNAITGQTAKELADFLHAEDCDVCFLCIGAIYRANNKQGTTKVPYRTMAIRDFYSGDSSFLRLLMSFVDGCRLFIRSLFIKSDVVIVMTEPPLLFFWFQLFRFLSKRKLFYWTMDVYPDAFAAGGFISERNLFFRFFKKIVYGKPPDFLIALGEAQRKYLERNFRSEVPNAIIPCGIIERETVSVPPAKEKPPIVFGYGGNIGAAHDAEFLIEFIRQLDPAKHSIILSLYGTKAEHVKKILGDHKAIQYKKFLIQSDIASIDVNLASLLPEWNHVSVPSKAVTAICCGSTLLLNAPPTADAWQMFAEAGWLVEPESNYSVSVTRFLQQLSSETILDKKINAVKIAQSLLQQKESAYQKVLTAVKQS